jgi:hypothetical protein
VTIFVGKAGVEDTGDIALLQEEKKAQGMNSMFLGSNYALRNKTRQHTNIFTIRSCLIHPSGRMITEDGHSNQNVAVALNGDKCDGFHPNILFIFLAN